MKQTNYEQARERYAQLGVDTDRAVKKLLEIKLSMQCWQGDDVRGFFFADRPLSGGIQATGNYPGAARTADELRADLEQALALIPGRHKINLHAIYGEAPGGCDLNAIEPKHYRAWVDWAREHQLGLDFNPTCFSHRMAESGMTLASADPAVRAFWIEHCRRARKIGEYFGRELGQRAVINIWIPDGMKDTPVDRAAPRRRLWSALDEVLREQLDPACALDAVECKLFGIGSESYVVGSHEFYMAYAAKRGIALTLDSGHFHPTEAISDKISSVLLGAPALLLHVSRPVRWDSDHVVTLSDELLQIAHELVYADAWERVQIGLDYFDASINRVAAWVIGMRNTQKALLMALLEPQETLRAAELSGDLTTRLAMQEELKTMPFSAVWDHVCELSDVPQGPDWLREMKKYESDVLSKRGALWN